MYVLREGQNRQSCRIQEEKQKVEAEIAQWKSEITATASKKNPNSPFIMIDQRQMDALNSKIAQGDKKISDLKKALNKNIDQKVVTYQAWNILGVPILIIIIGLVVVLINKQRTAAR